jgi:hypothetical protein
MVRDSGRTYAYVSGDIVLNFKRDMSFAKNFMYISKIFIFPWGHSEVNTWSLKENLQDETDCNKGALACSVSRAVIECY